jgi:peroxiredoxin/mono/diheme cytochrome c family protein
MLQRLSRTSAVAGLALSCALLASAWARVPKPKPIPVDEPPLDRLVGSVIPNFTLDDAASGERVSLYGFAGKKAVVIVFTGIDCPIGNSYMPRLAELSKQYAPRGVAFLAINTNDADKPEKVAAHAREFALDFPVLLDAAGRATRLLEGQSTCETLVIDAKARLRYRGAIDDQYGYGVRRERAVRNHLVDALEALLAGEPIETSATSVVGCPIEAAAARRPTPRVRPLSDEVIAAALALDPEVDPDSLGEVTYAEHVAPILQNKCQSCHRPDQVGPFPLLTFDDAERRAEAIHQALSTHRMPPWQADPRHGRFVNDRRLTSRERAMLLAWVEQRTPRGDAALEPPPRSFPEGWTIGTPDAVFQIPAPYTVKPDGTLPYQRFRVKSGFSEDRWLQAIEPQPTERAVVHHIVIYLIPPGVKARDLGELEHLAAYAPGDLPSVFPPGAAKRIPAGSEFLFEIHYTPNGKTRFDQSRLGLIFAKEPPKYRVRTIGIPNMKFELKPESSDTQVVSNFTFPEDSQIIGYLPHMHLRGKSFKYTAHFPDGREETLLSVPRYDFAWQTYYWLDTPAHMPKGTRLHCEAHFDNSASNPFLTPDDTRQTVTWGDQTDEEMMIGYIDALTPIEAPPPAEPRESDSDGS